MTPGHYSRRKLKNLLKNQSYELYHWSPLEGALGIINDGYIQSKATLLGQHLRTRTDISHLRTRNLRTDSENGFMDYVFLGNTNWKDLGYKSYYGGICFVINPLKVLPYREFFVYPFNTGVKFSKRPEIEKVSDISTLHNALEQHSNSYEVLVRRRIPINTNTIKGILCPPEDAQRINDELEKLGESGFNVTTQKEIITPPQSAIEIKDPSTENSDIVIYDGDEYYKTDNTIYVRTKSSNCIITLHVDTTTNKLIDPYTKEPIGEFKSKIAVKNN